jgi:hypothetical protein
VTVAIHPNFLELSIFQVFMVAAHIFILHATKFERQYCTALQWGKKVHSSAEVEADNTGKKGDL